MYDHFYYPFSKKCLASIYFHAIPLYPSFESWLMKHYQTKMMSNWCWLSTAFYLTCTFSENKVKAATLSSSLRDTQWPHHGAVNATRIKESWFILSLKVDASKVNTNCDSTYWLRLKAIRHINLTNVGNILESIQYAFLNYELLYCKCYIPKLNEIANW
jgi:hypothetical protein